MKFTIDWYQRDILMDAHEYNKIDYILNTHRSIDAHAVFFLLVFQEKGQETTTSQLGWHSVKPPSCAHADEINWI